MSLKLLGGLLILFVGGATALGMGAWEKKRIRLLQAWIDLLFHIRTQIDCYLTPIGELLSTADHTLLIACNGKGGEETPQALLEHCRSELPPEALRLLASFAGEIGGSYREEQVKRCDFYMEALNRILEKEKEALPARLRVRSALCLSAALATAILLW